MVSNAALNDDDDDNDNDNDNDFIIIIIIALLTPLTMRHLHYLHCIH